MPPYVSSRVYLRLYLQVTTASLLDMTTLLDGDLVSWKCRLLLIIVYLCVIATQQSSERARLKTTETPAHYVKHAETCLASADWFCVYAETEITSNFIILSEET
jgi:hypothetical protein